MVFFNIPKKLSCVLYKINLYVTKMYQNNFANGLQCTI